jgi:hypothetical protein
LIYLGFIFKALSYSTIASSSLPRLESERPLL